MKKYIIPFLILIMSYAATYAQQDKREKLKAYKTAYITQQLDLTSKEAEKFWPIYNAYEKNIFQLKVITGRELRKEIKEKGGFEMISEQEANQILQKLIKNDQAELNAKKELYNNLKPIVSSKKLLKLIHAEREFNRKLLSDYRKNNPRKGR